MTADLHVLLDTDPAAGLRGVAALMRERAEAATPGPWVVTQVGGLPIVFDAEDLPEPVVYDQELRAANAEHIASWSPVVALAVADWLDALARAVERSGVAHHPEPASIYAAAIATARAYLDPR